MFEVMSYLISEIDHAMHIRRNKGYQILHTTIVSNVNIFLRIDKNFFESETTTSKIYENCTIKKMKV